MDIKITESINWLNTIIETSDYCEASISITVHEGKIKQVSRRFEEKIR
ncbi:MAG: hypothetical protein KBA61_08145 [Spirochaetes bacterium]|nr:hypothetical protein [Spirochaetota bacterium]